MSLPTLARQVAQRRATRVRLASPLSALAWVLAIGIGAGAVWADPIREDDLKAVFLFNFAQFVEWPSEAFPEASSPFVICILGDDPFGKSLDEIVAHEVIHQHEMVVRRHREVEEVSTCHILYVSPSESPKLSHIVAVLDGRPVLTVGDSDEFTARSGIIQFLVVENRLRLRINAGKAELAKLSISSQLLRQAEIVGSK